MHKFNTFVSSCLSSQVVSNVLCCRDLSKAEHVAITLLIVAVCTSISLAYDCLGIVLELNVSHTYKTSLLFVCSGLAHKNKMYLCVFSFSLVNVFLTLIMLSLSYLSRVFCVPHRWSSSSHLRVTSNSPWAIGFRVKTWCPSFWYYLACLSWSLVWSWLAYTHKTVHTVWRCSTVRMPTSLALYHLYKRTSTQIIICIERFEIHKQMNVDTPARYCTFNILGLFKNVLDSLRDIYLKATAFKADFEPGLIVQC